MKILIDGRSMTAQFSGIGRYTLELAKGYIRQYGEDNVMTIVNKPIDYFPFKYIVCPYDRHKINDNIRFSRWLSKQDYDIYHSGDMIGPFWHKKGVKHIVTCHDLMFFIVTGFFRTNPIKAYVRKCRLKLFFRTVLQDADMIVSVSQTTHDDLKRIYGLESVVVREGINPIEHEKNINGYKGLTKDSFFLYVGLGSSHKNIDFMVNAFLESKTEKKLVICGKGHHPVSSDRIIYTGYATDEQLHFLYQNCAAFIFPSKYEGFGLPILEALSYHCRIFSSNAGSLGEFSSDVVSFFNPEKKEELINLIEKCDTINIERNKIDNYLENFNWENIWKEFFRKYQYEK